MIGLNGVVHFSFPILVHFSNPVDNATVSFRNAEALRDAYLATGVDFAFHPLEGWGHNIFDGTVLVDGQSLEELGFDFLVSRQGLIVE